MDNDERIGYLAGDANSRLDQDERAELDELRGVLADPAVWMEPSPDLQERIVAAITDARRSDADSTSDESVATDVPVARGPAARHRHRHRHRRLTYALLGAAAVALLAVGVTVLAGHHGASPVQYAASLSGTTLAPHAFGDAKLTRTTSGWRIQLQATGLPRRDNGTYYEAWLKNDAGDLVPIGTFNQGEHVTLWSAVPPSTYPMITVTREVSDGDQSSSGQVVVIGTVHRDD
jgi:hypothetical protein